MEEEQLSQGSGAGDGQESDQSVKQDDLTRRQLTKGASKKENSYLKHQEEVKTVEE